MNQFLNDTTGFREFLLSTHVPYVVTSPEGKFLMANEAFATTLGYTSDELEMVDLYPLTHPDDRAISRTMIEAMLRGERQGDHLIKRYLHKAGGEIWVDLNATLLRRPDGQPRFFITSIVDITEQRRATENLEASEREFRQLFDTMREGFSVNRMLYDGTGKPVDFVILKVNSAYERHTGLSPEQVVGHRMLEIFPQADPAQIAAYGRVAMTGVPYVVEYYSKTFQRHLSVRTYQTAPDHFATIFEDITERKKLEELIQRTDKLEAIGLLAGGIAHDFNNFLASLAQWLEVAQASADPGTKVATTLEKALRTFDRGRSLTQQLLTFSKGGAPVLETGSLLDIIEKNVRFALSGSSVHVTYDLAPDLWLVDFDANQLGQVLDNLVINANQAMSSVGQLRVRARNLEGEQQVLVEVQDSGPGIPQEVLARVFDPFFTTKPHGNGLGLATCHSIVGKHGGTITVESVLGQGSTFLIRLPVSRNSGAAVVAPRPALQSGHGRILVLDDELEIREALGEMLDMMGYQVSTAAHGAEALDLAERAVRQGRPFHAALLDLTIPGGDGGREIARPLKALDPHLKLYVSSGYTDGDIMANPRAFGFDASLVKPFSMAELSQLLAQGLGPNPT